MKTDKTAGTPQVIAKFSGSDIEIAQAVYPKYALHIKEIARRAGIPDEFIE